MQHPMGRKPTVSQQFAMGENYQQNSKIQGHPAKALSKDASDAASDPVGGKAVEAENAASNQAQPTNTRDKTSGSQDHFKS